VTASVPTPATAIAGAAAGPDTGTPTSLTPQER